MVIHQFFAKNEYGDDYFVGDIHGELSQLLNALKQLKFDFTRDRLFSVGDIVDRGPDSLACLALLNKPWFFAVRGNHELMLLADQASELSMIHQRSGGEWFYQSKEIIQLELQQMIRKHCPYAITVQTSHGNIGVTHAQAPDDWRQIQITSDEEQADKCDLLEKLLWSTQQYQDVKKGALKKIENIDVTVHGHVNCRRVTTGLNQIWLDTLQETKRLTVLSSKQVFMII